MKTKKLDNYLKSQTDEQLKELINSGLFDDLKLPELLNKIKAELDSRAGNNQPLLKMD